MAAPSSLQSVSWARRAFFILSAVICLQGFLSLSQRNSHLSLVPIPWCLLSLPETWAGISITCEIINNFYMLNKVQYVLWLEKYFSFFRLSCVSNATSFGLFVSLFNDEVCLSKSWCLNLGTSKVDLIISKSRYVPWLIAHCSQEHI